MHKQQGGYNKIQFVTVNQAFIITSEYVMIWKKIFLPMWPHFFVNFCEILSSRHTVLVNSRSSFNAFSQL